MHLTTAITLPYRMDFSVRNCVIKLNISAIKLVQGPLGHIGAGAFCMGHYAVAWAALSRIGRKVVNVFEWG
eukprot:359750-Chlamydomonas_euryale.AAC.4